MLNFLKNKNVESSGQMGVKAHDCGKKSAIKIATAALLCTVTVLMSGCSALNVKQFGNYSSESSDGGNVVLTRDLTTVVNQRSEAEALTISEVASIVCDTVVEITTEFRTVGYFSQVTSGAGSGVIIAENGYIITNNHVIADTDNNDQLADSIKVRLTSGAIYEAEVIGSDSDSDIAVIKINESGLKYASFGDSDSLVVGEGVVAVGNPLGTLGGTVTNGIISALDREIDVDGNTMTLLQTNAAVNPGNSGGGLFNMAGNLIGIVNAKSSGTGIEGLAFAIPSNDAYAIACELIEYGYVRGKVFLGVTFADVTSQSVAYRYFGSTAIGVYVVETVEGYNDQILQYGDRIIAVNGTEISESSDISAVLKNCAVGDEIEVTLYRQKKLTTVTLTCFEKTPDGVSFDD